MMAVRIQAGLPAVVDAILPARCLHCGHVARGGSWSPFLCLHCADQMEFRRRAVELGDGHRGYAGFLFEGPARSLMHALKYQGVTAVAGPVGERLAVLVNGSTAEILVPIPLHWRRRWVRGHNQARTLARAVARVLPAVQRVDALVRVRATAPQVRLGRARRQANLRGAFAVRARYRLRIVGRSIALIDDVMTTGRTMLEAAAVLRSHGAGQITLFAAAVAPLAPPRAGSRGGLIA